MADSTRHAIMGALDKKGGGGKAGKTHTRSIHIRRADSGGYIAKHEMQGADGEPAPDQEHVVPDAAALGDHVQAAMGDQPPAQMPGQGQDTPPQTPGA